MFVIVIYLIRLWNHILLSPYRVYKTGSLPMLLFLRSNFVMFLQEIIKLFLPPYQFTLNLSHNILVLLRKRMFLFYSCWITKALIWMSRLRFTYGCSKVFCIRILLDIYCAMLFVVKYLLRSVLDIRVFLCDLFLDIVIFTIDVLLFFLSDKTTKFPILCVYMDRNCLLQLYFYFIVH